MELRTGNDGKLYCRYGTTKVMFLPMKNSSCQVHTCVQKLRKHLDSAKLNFVLSTAGKETLQGHLEYNKAKNQIWLVDKLPNEILSVEHLEEFESFMDEFILTHQAVKVTVMSALEMLSSGEEKTKTTKPEKRTSTCRLLSQSRNSSRRWSFGSTDSCQIDTDDEEGHDGERPKNTTRSILSELILHGRFSRKGSVASSTDSSASLDTTTTHSNPSTTVIAELIS
mmetsp:Transcript_16838/g.24374  ORF Transcript_16838/g.24374 Transcript_16838/m.24374 type:complete len:225 (+) Transcript_16838:165-839(+)|eukprot:CAMPEP_0202443592 /NCGR_PEP_ID=MMETSP1360-20130828/2808_1 /ASSEMBLY_ACC=CAM_ASM_000848 /TAXON_ID=515479 /ORGANISM="Licmophora paradoxa, Strain CCMP2313" /LENGTH=224 /DNA_ID=CAMNT_0049059319 /DNA_START=30 /DNA_END=704 /DNA_ORIENTATION=+